MRETNITFVQTSFEKGEGYQTQVPAHGFCTIHRQNPPALSGYQACPCLSGVLLLFLRSHQPVLYCRCLRRDCVSLLGIQYQNLPTRSCQVFTRTHRSSLKSPLEQSVSQQGLLISEPRKGSLRPVPEASTHLSILQAQKHLLVPLTPEAFEAARELFSLLVPASPVIQEPHKEPTLEPHAPVTPTEAPEHHLVLVTSMLTFPLCRIASRGKPAMISLVPPFPDSQPHSLKLMRSSPPGLEEMDSSLDSEVRSVVSGCKLAQQLQWGVCPPQHFRSQWPSQNCVPPPCRWPFCLTVQNCLRVLGRMAVHTYVVQLQTALQAFAGLGGLCVLNGPSSYRHGDSGTPSVLILSELVDKI